jgi:hypothetical protein
MPRTCDLVIGFHFQTPSEQIIVLETRAITPNCGTLSVERYLQKLPADIHAMGDCEERFGNPPVYCLFDELIKKVSLPIGMSDLLRLEGLYSRRSGMYRFCGILNKLNGLMGCGSLMEAVNGGLFPTVAEIQLIAENAPQFYSYPFDATLPPAIVRFAGGEKGLNFGKRALCRVVLPDALLKKAELEGEERGRKGQNVRLTTYSLSLCVGSEKGKGEGGRGLGRYSGSVRKHSVVQLVQGSARRAPRALSARMSSDGNQIP